MPEVSASPAISLTVVVGAPTFIKALPQDQPLLLIEANLQRSRQISNELDGQGRAVMICSEVLATEAGSFVEWYHYNDGRLDGPISLAEWQQVYPNVQLLSQESRSGRLLKDLVQAWVDKHASNQSIALDLELRQGDPLTTLMGLGAWIQSVRKIQLDSPAVNNAVGSTLSDWLEQHGFQHNDDSMKSWVRNPLKTLQLIVNNQNQTIAELENRLQAAFRQRDEEQARATELSNQLDQMNSELQEMLSLINQNICNVP